MREHTTQRIMMRRTLLLLLWTVVASASWAAPMPQATAAHFCQLLVEDAEGNIKSINAFANGDAQLFAEYVFQYDGWRDLHVFPHNGQWYAATDQLPTTLNAEHQRYIQEVFPRMIREAEAEHWEVVDAYIDKLLEYQRQFSNTEEITAMATPLPVTVLLIILFALFLIVPLFLKLRKAQRTSSL